MFRDFFFVMGDADFVDPILFQQVCDFPTNLFNPQRGLPFVHGV